MTVVHEASRARRLKSGTHQTHDRLDRSIMEATSFDTIEGYGRFLEVQFLLHRDVAALYDNPVLGQWLPGLIDRRRLPLVSADLADLERPTPAAAAKPVFPPDAGVDLPTALGWLYVVEGSNMGAALLRKQAAKLGLSDDHGARHLAPAGEGPAAHWRSFTGALDAVALEPDQEDRVRQGAEAAFQRVQSYVDARLG